MDAATLQRGRDVWLQGRVIEAEVEQPSLDERLFRGVVMGSRDEEYLTDVSVSFDPRGRVCEFDGTCSCPMEVDCKHAVALVLACESRGVVPTAHATVQPILEPAHAEQGRKLMSWLRALGEHRGKAASDEAADRRVVFLLKESTGSRGLPVLDLSWAEARPKASGKGWTKPTRPSYYFANTYGPLVRPGLEREGLLMIRGLAMLNGSYGEDHRGRIDGEMGWRLLELAERSGRCFYQDARHNIIDRPLHLGETLPLCWHWESDPAAATWQLRSRLGSGEARLFANEPPLYFDAEAGVIGRVDAAGLEPAALAMLMRAPTVPEALLTEANAASFEPLLATPGVPALPRLAAPDDWPVTQPSPVLSIAPAEPGSGLGLFSTQLAQAYGSLRVGLAQGNATRLFQHEGRTVRLRRDVDAEMDAVRRLLALGFVRVGADTYAQREASRWTAWASNDWQELREAGFELEFDAALASISGPPAVLDLALQDAAEAGSPWFDLSLGLNIDGQRHDALPWLPELLAQVAFVEGEPRLPEWMLHQQPDGRWIRLHTAALQPAVRGLLELMAERRPGEGSLRLSQLEALGLGEGVSFAGAPAMKALRDRLGGLDRLPECAPPKGLKAQLRPYQAQGFEWLQFLREQGLGGLLADDMGLGKTLQTLAHLLAEKEAGRLDRPALVVAPVSLLGNWRREAERFAPALRLRLWHGPERRDGADFAECDLVIAPYSLLHRDREHWQRQAWHVLVLDEAQQIKNASSQAAKVAGSLDARQRIGLTGTPMENHLGELWSLFHFALPGLLGSQKRFAQLYRQPIERQGDSATLARLRQRITPFMLRRVKDDVLAELPPRQEVVTLVALDHAQADVYETVRLATEKQVRAALADRGMAGSQIHILDALLKLRQVCCDPRLLNQARRAPSAKLNLLLELLEELLAEGRRVLLFSQFTSMLSLIETELAARGWTWTKLTGQTRKRDEAIERFTGGEVPLMLISLKAGGTGLNLPQADTVIHYDPWWNPAVEEQATARAHRIGQQRQVMVYRLVAEGTLEERILALQARKAELARGVLAGAASRKTPMFTEDDLAALLQPLG